ncbi:MAG: RNA polymerase sigma factor [Eubacterium sp.]|jgi:RNA polymerase sigma-70 factor (ECF subfamily)|nr:RNA polymerase sigma factor [Eubacterium sp.]
MDHTDQKRTIGQIITEYGKQIYSFCVYITGDRDAADDLYQQTFLVAIEKEEIDTDRNPKSYLLSIAVNLWNNHKRKYLWRRKRADVVYFDEGDAEQLQDDSLSVEEDVERREEIERIRQTVQTLPDKLRVVILMHFMEELSVEEISGILGIPEGTVKSRIHKAKKVLKERLM